MTAPYFPDAHYVEGMTKAEILKVALQDFRAGPILRGYDIDHNTKIRLARAAVMLWEKRDSARETAIAQDAAVQKIQVKLFRLEALLKEAKRFQERGYESGFQEMNEAIAKASE